MVCKEICFQYKAVKPYDNNRYILGQKRCQACSIFMYWDGTFCPCCGSKLRIKPRKTTDKAKLRMRTKSIEIFITV